MSRFWRCSLRRCLQIVSIGTQLTEGMAGLERTTDILAENPEDQDPRRTVSIAKIKGEVVFDNVDFSYAEGKQVLYDVSFRAQPGTRDGARRSLRGREVDDHRLDRGVLYSRLRPRARGWNRPLDRAPR